MSDGVKGHQPTKSGQGRMLKAKKFLTTKVAKSKLGQNAIRHFLGVQGCNLLDALKAAATQDIGAAKAKEFVTSILVLACKGKLLHESKLITREHRAAFAKPVNGLATSIFTTMRDSKKKQVDVTNLSLKFSQMEEMLVDLLKDLMKPKNLEKVHSVCRYAGSKAFLSKLINDPAYTDTKATFYDNLTSLMRERLREDDLLPPPKVCKQPGCTSEAVPEDIKFAGSDYCKPHHLDQYTQLVASPSVSHFLVENGVTCAPIADLLQQHAPPHSRAMYIGVQNYTAAGANIKKVFAEGIYEKYLQEQATHPVRCFSEQCVATMREKRASGQSSLYREAEEELLAALSKAFQDHVLTSPQYQDYLTTRKLP